MINENSGTGILCYLWFGNGSNIDEVGLNFDPNCYFCIEKDTSSAKPIIKLIEKAHEAKIPKDFFGEAISAVTTIVGENGAGKSSVLRFILNNFLRETALNNSFYIGVFKDNDGYKIRHNFQWEVRLVGKDKDTIIIDSNVKISAMNYFNSVLMLSNVFDGYKEHYDSLGHYQSQTVISTLNHIVSEAFLKNDCSVGTMYRNQKILNPIFDYIIDQTLECLSFKEFRILFAKEFIGFPNAINFDIRYPVPCDKTSKLYNEFESKCYGSYFLPIITFDSKYDKYKQIRSETSDLIIIDEQIAAFDSARNRLAINYCNYLYTTSDDLELEFAEDFFRELSLGVKNGMQILKDIINNGKYGILADDIWLIQNLNELFDGNVFNQYLSDKIVIRFDQYLSDVNQLNNLKRIRQLLNKSERSSVFDLSFTNIVEKSKKVMYSSGELLRLRVLIELYKFSRKVKEKSTTNRNILILFDEWDLYMHPNYQRRGFYEITKIINKLFDGYSVQLIITSNSPYVLSDVPSNCVIAMKDGGVANVFESTFGTNIHTLLRNQFFMETTIGEFAKAKINHVYSIMRSPGPLSDMEKNELKEVIDLVGEPLVRIKLQGMYASIFPDEQDRQLAFYENKIKELTNALQSNTALDRDKMIKLKEGMKDSLDALDKVINQYGDI